MEGIHMLENHSVSICFWELINRISKQFCKILYQVLGSQVGIVINFKDIKYCPSGLPSGHEILGLMLVPHASATYLLWNSFVVRFVVSFSDNRASDLEHEDTPS